MFTPYDFRVHAPVGCDPFIKDNTQEHNSVRAYQRARTFFTSAEARLQLYRSREEECEVMLVHQEKDKNFTYTSFIIHFKSRDAYSLLVKMNDMEIVRADLTTAPLLDMEANFYELAVKLSVLCDLKRPTTLTFTVPDQWSITREETWEFTRAINNDLTGRAYGTAIKYETTTMEVYKWIYVLFKMYSEPL